MQQLFQDTGLAIFGLAIGVGLIVIGAAIAIAWIAKASLDATARQPEAASSLQTQMIVAAGLIEGFTFFALASIWFGLAPK
jgi:F-type H+-transporting ATPase subunit c